MDSSGYSQHIAGNSSVCSAYILVTEFLSYRMKRHAAIKYFSVLYLSIALFWYAIGAELIQEQFEHFQSFKCDNVAVCATSKPSRSFAARSQVQCTVECQLLRESCVGVNFLGMDNTCEIFASIPINVSQTVAGCQYFQKPTATRVFCYEFGLQSVARATTLGSGMFAMSSALLNGQLYVTGYGYHELHAYSRKPFQLLQTIPITNPTLGMYAYGMAADVFNYYIYIADRDNNMVRRVNLANPSNVTVTSWNVPGCASGLSVTSTGNVLLGYYGGSGGINEYTSGGSLVRSVADSNQPMHALQMNDGTWLFSREINIHGIGMVSTNGIVTTRFGSSPGSGMTQMNGPRGMAIDANGYMFVADCYNNRILLLDPTLTTARLFPLPANLALFYPNFVTIDRELGQIYVGEEGGSPLSRLLAIEIY